MPMIFLNLPWVSKALAFDARPAHLRRGGLGISCARVSPEQSAERDEAVSARLQPFEDARQCDHRGGTIAARIVQQNHMPGIFLRQFPFDVRDDFIRGHALVPIARIDALAYGHVAGLLRAQHRHYLLGVCGWLSAL